MIEWPESQLGTGEDVCRDPFSQHAERMRDFLRSHLTLLIVRTTPLAGMVPYDVRHNLVETGGSVDTIDKGDWPLLVPLREVTGRQVVPN